MVNAVYIKGHYNVIIDYMDGHLYDIFATYKVLKYVFNLHIKTSVENGKCKLYN